MQQRCLGNELVPFYIFFLDLVFLSFFRVFMEPAHGRWFGLAFLLRFWLVD